MAKTASKKKPAKKNIESSREYALRCGREYLASMRRDGAFMPDDGSFVQDYHSQQIEKASDITVFIELIRVILPLWMEWGKDFFDDGEGSSHCIVNDIRKKAVQLRKESSAKIPPIPKDPLEILNWCTDVEIAKSKQKTYTLFQFIEKNCDLPKGHAIESKVQLLYKTAKKETISLPKLAAKWTKGRAKIFCEDDLKQHWSDYTKEIPSLYKLKTNPTEE